MFYSIIKEINNANYKEYVDDKLKKKLGNEDSHHAKAILDSFKLQTIEKIKTEENHKNYCLKSKIRKAKNRNWNPNTNSKQTINKIFS